MRKTREEYEAALARMRESGLGGVSEMDSADEAQMSSPFRAATLKREVPWGGAAAASYDLVRLAVSLEGYLTMSVHSSGTCGFQIMITRDLSDEEIAEARKEAADV